MRIAMGIEYAGHAFYGWQAQKDQKLPTIQSALESALSKVADEPIATICAGRTDRGVHASAQVVHFDTRAKRSPHAWQMGANTLLPRAIRVTWMQTVPDDFHARYSARSRRYNYLLYNHKHHPGIASEHVGWYYYPLNVAAMHEAAQTLLGEHDFSAFRGAGCQAKSAVRTLTALNVSQHGRIIRFDVEANAFLLHMVRNLVGSLVQVGRGEAPVAWLRAVLDARDRREAGVTMSPNGLYLTKVSYPDYPDIPQSWIQPWCMPNG